ncbi:hypothetical protein ASPZODRAFT_28268 [Penicilliopsis zonata CBS 506.65]|uniref:Uncharacterized protein n=1 Tax=Penicilliopsis zonata CBS 506.65 TaxID=1073090 RepID=A0A1L9S8Y0_9EURO|nr:hypothetical protein ASPZODRAFT_28268 [Penicilliopsis zonata CBS 506.65]OJJ43616.1 hypothetical protein ASPZODRAFT_28268 [Penicilliopsis zonata CBS 506.65]
MIIHVVSLSLLFHPLSSLPSFLAFKPNVMASEARDSPDSPDNPVNPDSLEDEANFADDSGSEWETVPESDPDTDFTLGIPAEHKMSDYGSDDEIRWEDQFGDPWEVTNPEHPHNRRCRWVTEEEYELSPSSSEQGGKASDSDSSADPLWGYTRAKERPEWLEKRVRESWAKDVIALTESEARTQYQRLRKRLLRGKVLPLEHEDRLRKLEDVWGIKYLLGSIYLTGTENFTQTPLYYYYQNLPEVKYHPHGAGLVLKVHDFKDKKGRDRVRLEVLREASPGDTRITYQYADAARPGDYDG